MTDLPGGPPADWSAELADPLRYRDVRKDATVLPVHVSGTVDGPPPGGAALAVSVNGTIGGWGRPEAPPGDDAVRFAVMVPPSLLRDGANVIKLYALEGGPGAVSLRPVDLVS